MSYVFCYCGSTSFLLKVIRESTSINATLYKNNCFKSDAFEIVNTNCSNRIIYKSRIIYLEYHYRPSYKVFENDSVIVVLSSIYTLPIQMNVVSAKG